MSRTASKRHGSVVTAFIAILAATASAPLAAEDESMAGKLWEKLQGANYRSNWSTVPGKGTLYAGQPPHGARLSTYLNAQAKDGMEGKRGPMPKDAIIVKENYTPANRLAAVTVMYKEEGYDPAHGDWFWAKYAPDGKVEAAGKVAGCISCHGSVRSNDYIFTFPIATISP